MFWEKVRDDFPILKVIVHNHPLIYLDNAATTQLPQPVIDTWVQHYTKYNGNVHRGIHYLSEASTQHMEETRAKVAAFLHAAEEDCIVFTSGATDAANLVAQSFLKQRLQPGDVVVSTELEHHANFVVWQQLCKERGAEFAVIPTMDGDLDMEAAARLLKENVKLLAVTAVSNVTGTVVDLKPLIELAHRFGIPVFVDAAQALRHMPFDLSELQADFLGFSAHKIMGPTGVGCLYIREKYCEEMRPYRYGGGMVDLVKKEDTTFASLPARLEAGTPNYSGIIAFGAALDYLSGIGWQRIYEREDILTKKAEEVLSAIPELTLLGHPKKRAGVLSFLTESVHPYDLASFLDQFGIALRTGSMCAQPIVNRFGTDTITRLSPAFYNTEEELEQTADALRKVLPLLRR